MERTEELFLQPVLLYSTLLLSHHTTSSHIPAISSNIFSPLCHQNRDSQAGKYYAAALQLDPDNKEAMGKYKTLRIAVSETVRIRGEIEKALAG
jgi:hypothetical protein